MEQTLIAQGPVDVNVRPAAWMTANDWGREPLVTSAESVRDAWIYDARRVTPLFAVPDGWALVPKQPPTEAAEFMNSIKCAMCSNEYTPRPGFAQSPNCCA